VWADAEDIVAWIADLPKRIKSGELAGIGPVDLGPDAWLVSAELAARTLLGDLTRLNRRCRRREDPSIARRRAALLRQLMRLRALIG
jgi:hypothetical protein